MGVLEEGVRELVSIGVGTMELVEGDDREGEVFVDLDEVEEEG